ncbi:uncharacterized protein BN452_00675 [Clostridium sp. CAG:1013]|nr:uncharacterized protein BN452_00675 [Clostridium sp. CAG:1013]
MGDKICFFIGHREAPESIYPELAQTVEQLIEQGVTDFYVGHYGNFDRLAARAVIAAKQRHPEVRLTMLLPYHPAERNVILPSGFDGSLYPPSMENVPRRFAIVHANRWMVEHCTHLVAYVTHPASNAGKVVEWGRIKGKKVAELF